MPPRQRPDLKDYSNASLSEYLRTAPLGDIDIADPIYWETDSHWNYFKRLRDEAPIHFTAQNANRHRGYWSVTRWADIMAVDTNHQVFSSDSSLGGITLRAQDAGAGDLFAALPGASAHGAEYARAALDAGAVAVFTDAEGVAVISRLLGDPAPVPVVVHPAPRSVLGALAAAVYGHPSDRVVVLGVTGTSGKTTTAYLIEAGLRAAGRLHSAFRCSFTGGQGGDEQRGGSQCQAVNQLH